MANRPKPAHYKGSYHVRARAIRRAAYMNPATTCWRCGRTLNQHPNTKTGQPPRWTAGHVIDGDPLSPLLPEVQVCNYSAGGKLPHTVTTTRRW